MKRILRNLAAATLLLAALLFGVAEWQQRAAVDQPLRLQAERLLEVPAGATPGGLFKRLEQEGVIDGAFWLRLYWRFNLQGTSLPSGEYRLQPGQSMRDLIGLWQRGEVVDYRLTLVEGWNFRQLRAALDAAPALGHSLQGLSDAELMQRLGLEGQHPEGRFFPDTYSYVRGMQDADLLRKAHARLEQVLDEEWGKRAAGLPYKTPYEALVMASLVEKETGMAEERPRIAGVFLRRLQTGMLLQTDPAVIYGLGERYQGDLTRAHLREPGPYNTYTSAGLPPTPIAMVGREAIHAALHPQAGDALYFVARGDGSHAFSASLDAHNKAVREYQLKRRADYRASPPPSPSASQEKAP